MKIVFRFKSGFELPITCEGFKYSKNIIGEIVSYDIEGIKDNRPLSFRLEDLECVYQIMDGAQPERKSGAWTDNNACPFCGFRPWYEADIHTLSFCPNCGADMGGENND